MGNYKKAKLANTTASFAFLYANAKQNVFLNGVQQSQSPVTVILVNGFQMRGTIKHHDNFTVELESEGKLQVIYKHAISTIIPINPVNISGAAQ